MHAQAGALPPHEQEVEDVEEEEMDDEEEEESFFEVSPTMRPVALGGTAGAGKAPPGPQPGARSQDGGRSVHGGASTRGLSQHMGLQPRRGFNNTHSQARR